MMSTAEMTSEFVTITGVGVYSTTYLKCKFGSTVTQGTYYTASSIKCEVPFIGSAGLVPISVSNDGQNWYPTGVSLDVLTSCPITVTTGPSPPGQLTGNSATVTFDLTVGCSYLPTIKCYFGSQYSTAVVTADNITCTAPSYGSTLLANIAIEAKQPGKVANVSTSYKFQYYSLVASTVSPSVGHNDSTVLKICGTMVEYSWSVPKCVFGSYQRTATFVDGCMQCTFYSTDNCVNNVANLVRLSLYPGQISPAGANVVHTCLPFIRPDVVANPPYVIVAPTMDTLSIQVTGLVVYNSANLRCQYGSLVVEGTYLSTTQLNGSFVQNCIIRCQIPYMGTAREVTLSISNDAGQNYVNALTFVVLTDCLTSVSTGPTPPGQLLNTFVDVNFNYTRECNYIPSIRCFFNDTAITGDASPTTATCNVGAPDVPANVPVIVEFSYNGKAYNSSNTMRFDYYTMPNPKSADPWVAHTGLTDITLCGENMQNFTWAQPICIFSGVIRPATFVAENCVVCEYYSTYTCSNTNPQGYIAVVSLFGAAQVAVQGPIVKHVCQPFILGGATATPNYLIFTEAITSYNITFTGIASYNSPFLRCKFGADQVVNATYLSATSLSCPVPALPGTGNVQMFASNDGGQTWTSTLVLDVLAQCTVTLTNGPNPPRSPSLRHTNASFAIATACIYPPVVHCHFGDQVVVAVTTTGTVICRTPNDIAAGSVPLTLEVIQPGITYNIGTDLVYEFYDVSPMSVEPAVAHSNMTNITICGDLSSGGWATPKCAFGGLYRDARFVSSSCIECLYYSPNNCSDKLTNNVYVSLFENQNSTSFVTVSHICEPLVYPNVTTEPRYVIISDEMININVTITGVLTHNSSYLLCKFHDLIVSAKYVNESIVVCPMPHVTTPGNYTVMLSNDGGQTWVGSGPIEILDSCEVAVLTGPTPPSVLLNVNDTLEFSVSIACRYVPVMRCYLGDRIIPAIATATSVTCELLEEAAPVHYDLTIEVDMPGSTYNVSEIMSFDFYEIIPQTVSPVAAHSGVTNITVCGETIKPYPWAVPRCLFGTFVRDASFVNDSCITCKYYSSASCSSKITNYVQVSLYQTDYSVENVSVVHVCTPTVSSGVSLVPAYIIVAPNMTQFYATVTGVTVYNSHSLQCRIADAVQDVVYIDNTMVSCPIPYVVTYGDMMVSVSNDGGQTWMNTTSIEYWDGYMNCSAGYQTGYLDGIRACVRCSKGYYKDVKSKAWCTKCGDFMDTTGAGSTTIMDCRCNTTGMVPVNNREMCECDAGLYFDNVTGVCLSCPIGSYKTFASNTEQCTPCGAMMTTLQGASTTSTSCVCKSAPMIIVNNHDHCECDVGHYLDVAAQACYKCPFGYWKNTTVDGQCIQCMHNFTTNFEAAVDIDACVCPGRESKVKKFHANGTFDTCTCSVGYFNHTVDTCKACYANAYCAGGNVPPIAKPGYYASKDNGIYIPCSPSWACTGADECSEGYTGYMCASCVDDYFKEDSGRCKKCGDSQAYGFYAIAACVVILPFLVFAGSIDGNKHDARYGMLFIMLAWCQYAALFTRVEITWTKSAPGYYIMEYISALANVALVNSRPDCAIGMKLDYFFFNFAIACIPFVMAFITLLYYMTLLLWGAILYMIGRRPMQPEDAAKCNSSKTVLVALVKPLAKSQRMRLRWGLVRSMFTVIFATALPSWLGFITIFDCTRVQTSEGEVWMNDMSRDKECFADNEYFMYVGLHLVVALIWLLIIVLYVRKSHEVGSSIEDVIISHKYGGMFVRYKKAFKNFGVLELIKKFAIAVCVLCTNTRPWLQIGAITAMFTLFGAYTLLFGPHRSTLCNNADGLLNLLLGATMMAGWLYENDDGQQSLMVFVLLAVQLVIIILSYIIEAFKRRRTNNSINEMVNYVQNQLVEKTKAVTSASDAFKKVVEDIIANAKKQGIKGSKKQSLYLLERHTEPTLSYEDSKAYDRVLRVFSDGGPWKRIHSMAVADPNSKAVEQFITNIENVGVRVDGGPLIKLVGILMAANNLTFASMAMNTLRSALVDVSLNDISILMSYCTQSLIRLQTDIGIALLDDMEVKNVMMEVQTTRSMLINLVERYDDYNTRMKILSIKLPDGKNMVKDVLAGADHSYVLYRIEPKSKREVMASRLSCRGSTIDRDLVSSKEAYASMTTTTMVGVSGITNTMSTNASISISVASDVVETEMESVRLTF